MLYITKTLTTGMCTGTTIEIEKIPSDMVPDFIKGWKNNIKTFGYIDEDTVDSLGIKVNTEQQYPTEGDHILLIENGEYFLITLEYITANNKLLCN